MVSVVGLYVSKMRTFPFEVLVSPSMPAAMNPLQSSMSAQANATVHVNTRIAVLVHASTQGSDTGHHGKNPVKMVDQGHPTGSAAVRLAQDVSH